MKGNQQIIDVLNDALTAEVTAVNQIFPACKDAEELGLQVARQAREG